MKVAADNPQLNVPGPRPMPVFGRTNHLLRLASDSIGYTRHLFQTYGQVVSLNFGTSIYSPLLKCPGTVFAYGPEFVRTVATQHEIYYKFPLTGNLYRRELSKRTEPLKRFLAGLFGDNSEKHRQTRQLMMPAFHKQRIESYRDDMVAITQSVLERISIEETCDIAQVMRLLTMRVVTKTLLGYDIGDRALKIGRLLQDALSIMGTPALALLPFDVPGLPFHRFLNLITQFDDEIKAAIAQKRAVGTDDQDLLSLLIQARDAQSGTRLSEDELLGHTGVLFFAGYETSSNALTWTLFLLSQHPELAADLLDELQSVLRGEAPTVEQLQQLPLLERVIKESMRVLPPVPWNGRVLSQPTTFGSYDLPAGTEVFISIYQTHQMPELYPEPEVFNPRRWEGFEPTMFEYNPFSAGSRLCIGAAFAMMEIKIVLALLLQHYRLQCIPKSQIDRQGLIVMVPKYGMPMTIHKQDRQFTSSSVRGNVLEMVKLPAESV